VDDSKQYHEISDKDVTKLIWKFQNLNDLIALSLIHWYFPKEIFFLVHLFLEEAAWPKDYPYDVKEILLTSKEVSIGWLFFQSRWTERDFFGNILNKRFARKVEKLKFRRISRRPVKKYTGYCRGHHDNNRHENSISSVRELQRETRGERYLREYHSSIREARTLSMLEAIQGFLDTA
jgi:hypothetical protein